MGFQLLKLKDDTLSNFAFNCNLRRYTKGWGPAGTLSAGNALALLWNAVAQPLLFALIGYTPN